MSVAFRQLRVYVRTIIVVAVLAAIAMVLFKNRGFETRVWFFWLTGEEPVGVVWLMLCTALATLVAWWAVSMIRGLVRDAREVQRARGIEIEKRRLAQREAELKEREQRLGSRMQETVADEEPEVGEG